MLRRTRLALATAALLASAAPVAASPASMAPSRDAAEAAFDEFAAGWMARLRELAQRQQEQRAAAPGGGAGYSRYGDEFRVELRATGSPSTPYVGLLHYSEHVYRCQDGAASQCALASTVPVTEIFRFTDGRWSY